MMSTFNTSLITVDRVFKTLNDEQKELLYFAIGSAMEDTIVIPFDSISEIQKWTKPQRQMVSVMFGDLLNKRLNGERLD